MLHAEPRLGIFISFKLFPRREADKDTTLRIHNLVFVFMLPKCVFNLEIQPVHRNTSDSNFTFF